MNPKLTLSDRKQIERAEQVYNVLINYFILIERTVP